MSVKLDSDIRLFLKENFSKRSTNTNALWVAALSEVLNNKFTSLYYAITDFVDRSDLSLVERQIFLSHFDYYKENEIHKKDIDELVLSKITDHILSKLIEEETILSRIFEFHKLSMSLINEGKKLDSIYSNAISKYIFLDDNLLKNISKQSDKIPLPLILKTI